MSNDLVLKPLRLNIALATLFTVFIATVSLAILAAPASASGITSLATGGVATQVDGPNTTLVEGGQGGDIGILPRPNSGSAPKSSNERGGWEQYAVMTAIVVALGTIVVLIRRESKRSKIVFEQRHQKD